MALNGRELRAGSTSRRDLAAGQSPPRRNEPPKANGPAQQHATEAEAPLGRSYVLNQTDKRDATAGAHSTADKSSCCATVNSEGRGADRAPSLSIPLHPCQKTRQLGESAPGWARLATQHTTALVLRAQTQRTIALAYAGATVIVCNRCHEPLAPHARARESFGKSDGGSRF